MNNHLTQGTLEWLKMRNNYIGASDSPVILGLAKWKLRDGRIKTPYILWQEKLGLIEANSKSSATDYGTGMEAQARSAYEVMTGDLVAPEVIFHKEIPYMMASLDGLTIDKKLAVEIKCINREDHELAKKGIIPEVYMPQLQHQLMCLGHDMMHYFSYNSGEGVLVEVTKDDQYQTMLKEKLAAFWNCIISFTPPALTDDDYIEKGDTWNAIANDLFKVKEIIKNYSLQKELLEEKLKELSEGINCISKNYKYSKVVKKGCVDYSSIPELFEVDLEKYRSKPSEAWTLSIRKN